MLVMSTYIKNASLQESLHLKHSILSLSNQFLNDNY